MREQGDARIEKCSHDDGQNTERQSEQRNGFDDVWKVRHTNRQHHHQQDEKQSRIVSEHIAAEQTEKLKQDEETKCNEKNLSAHHRNIISALLLQFIFFLERNQFL